MGHRFPLLAVQLLPSLEQRTHNISPRNPHNRLPLLRHGRDRLVPFSSIMMRGLATLYSFANSSFTFSVLPQSPIVLSFPAEYTPDIVLNYCFYNVPQLFRMHRKFLQALHERKLLSPPIQQIAFFSSGTHSVMSSNAFLTAASSRCDFKYPIVRFALFSLPCCRFREYRSGFFQDDTCSRRQSFVCRNRYELAVQRCSFLDTEFGNTRLDCFRHSAQFLDFLDMLPCFMRQFVGQRF